MREKLPIRISEEIFSILKTLLLLEAGIKLEAISTQLICMLKLAKFFRDEILIISSEFISFIHVRIGDVMLYIITGNPTFPLQCLDCFMLAKQFCKEKERIENKILQIRLASVACELAEIPLNVVQSNVTHIVIWQSQAMSKNIFG